ncbi:hypothetical protein AMATHDRAFT_143577 [Amanita thiersii Skay4041]|uniref:Uncharacterized protein n=1 Tax=Amanita thiersii Skay4041 TaxID=703135 RepID=A0A2A9NTI0_9AGAR|nr:hypothetical protein AMATHDRAFT_143577 [Amanita thiersii Skay4041]
MSHSHSHAPGGQHSHSHSHGPQQPQQQQVPAPDPTLQALIDQDFKQVPLKLGPEQHLAVCEAHSLEKCSECDLDFQVINRMARILISNPNLLCPPPANVVTQKLTQMVTGTKEEGNTLFKKGLHAQAISRYTAAATFAVQRPPWEANQLMREELSTVMSNRSAAFYEAHDYISALADAETVIQLRRNWSKGHFRKAKALHALGQIAEASEAIRLGLSFEPNNSVSSLVYILCHYYSYSRLIQELNQFLMDLLAAQRKSEEEKVKTRNIPISA